MRRTELFLKFMSKLNSTVSVPWTVIHIIPMDKCVLFGLLAGVITQLVKQHLYMKCDVTLATWSLSSMYCSVIVLQPWGWLTKHYKKVSPTVCREKSKIDLIRIEEEKGPGRETAKWISTLECGLRNRRLTGPELVASIFSIVICNSEKTSRCFPSQQCCKQTDK